MSRQVPAFDVVFELIDVVMLSVIYLKLCVIRSFVQVFVQVREDRCCEDVVDVYVAVQLINEFRNVRCDPAIFLRRALVVNVSVIIDVGCSGDWVGESVDAFASPLAATRLSGKMILSVRYKFADLACERWVVTWDLCFNDVVDKSDRDIWPYLVTCFIY